MGGLCVCVCERERERVIELARDGSLKFFGNKIVQYLFHVEKNWSRTQFIRSQIQFPEISRGPLMQRRKAEKYMFYFQDLRYFLFHINLHFLLGTFKSNS